MVLNYLVDVLSKGRNAPYAPHPICDDSWAARGRWLDPELLEDQLTERCIVTHVCKMFEVLISRAKRAFGNL
jgi:hypothetical protein